MTLTYEDFYCKENVNLAVHSYASNDNLAIMMICAETHEPFASLTVNLDKKLISNQAFIDASNLRLALCFVINNKLGRLVGLGHSGFCDYPLIEFNMSEVKKYGLQE